MTIYSIGHSNLSFEAFLQLLKEHTIEILVDVRRYPSSRLHPHFNRGNLKVELEQHGIQYHWLGEQLGGMREQPYEIHVQSSAFSDGLANLQALADDKIVAFMCAEQFFVNCHRKFIADELSRRDWQVLHITGTKLLGHQGALL